MVVSMALLVFIPFSGAPVVEAQHDAEGEGMPMRQSATIAPTPAASQEKAQRQPHYASSVPNREGAGGDAHSLAHPRNEKGHAEVQPLS
jgi:hypothetical protein